MIKLELLTRIQNDWEDTDVLPVAVRVYKYFLDNLDELYDEEINIRSLCLSKGLDKDEVHLVMKVLDYFSNPNIGITKPHYQLYSGHIYDITADELYHAKNDGYLIHPLTGEKIFHYLQLIAITFKLSSSFIAEEEHIV